MERERDREAGEQRWWWCSCDVVGASARFVVRARESRGGRVGTKPKRARSGRSRRTIRRARESPRVTHARPPRFVVTVKAHAKH